MAKKRTTRTIDYVVVEQSLDDGKLLYLIGNMASKRFCTANKGYIHTKLGHNQRQSFYRRPSTSNRVVATVPMELLKG